MIVDFANILNFIDFSSSLVTCTDNQYAVTDNSPKENLYTFLPLRPSDPIYKLAIGEIDFRYTCTAGSCDPSCPIIRRLTVPGNWQKINAPIQGNTTWMHVHVMVNAIHCFSSNITLQMPFNPSQVDFITSWSIHVNVGYRFAYSRCTWLNQKVNIPENYVFIDPNRPLDDDYSLAVSPLTITFSYRSFVSRVDSFYDPITVLEPIEIIISKSPIFDTFH